MTWKQERMTTEMQAMTLFGGLAKMLTLKAIESGCLKTSENASVLITSWQANPTPAEDNSESAFLWRTSHSSFGWHSRPVNFSSREYSDSFVRQSNLVKNLVFYFIATWGDHGKLSQERICHAISPRPLSNSLISSISANLNSGVNQGFYTKSGAGKTATYSLTPTFHLSKQLKQIHFTPCQDAIIKVRSRARKHGKREA